MKNENKLIYILIFVLSVAIVSLYKQYNLYTVVQKQNIEIAELQTKLKDTQAIVNKNTIDKNNMLLDMDNLFALAGVGADFEKELIKLDNIIGDYDKLVKQVCYLPDEYTQNTFKYGYTRLLDDYNETIENIKRIKDLVNDIKFNGNYSKEKTMIKID